MQIEQIKSLVIEALEDMKAQNITVLDVRGRTSVTDWMIIANGTSNRHVGAVASNVEEKAKHAGLRPNGMEGRAAADWVLIDLIDVVVHVMTEQARHFYDLERLWGEPKADAEAGKRDA
ncbi:MULTISPECIES: ribosome silencing factor [Thalassolituus]|jgi:ribosome-associated protein|uniref:Ribosomal silencing factor RsfS n=2 Tax=root TaxID=1 RepID=M5E773_9GAMM|nr:ribosome silencing factor [Thalassolituus oleivorans]PHQ83995.1 MAG: ribosome silencing factor [Thalassobium sp.]AHK15027.1 iojap family protein [Thalassolituus oleivorans R6-15]MBQ0727194.1 ribosome silencing factor [Thalassolituus oleivorans]MBQ0780006.1 ribosome silencing factor [Thalassolituus oleivorans]MDF1640321.1 ribosome silencing factor [Thalassolituus oleivorans]|tara:strand:- start:179 stop:535 length:357 start_codon:yes stop_codon:yes gene_type:complete